jgi:(1->4)-alpha-D-glucan 1-alpha-D-glucosylmutase
MYQGTELWDLQLVDPDNRRPVDFERRRAFLDEIRQGCVKNPLALLERLCRSPRDGKIKLFLLYRAMNARKQNAALFRNGTYIPVTAEGPFQDHLVAFAREHQERWALTVVPRFTTFLVEEGEYPLGVNAWRDTRLRLPSAAPASWRDAVTEEVLEMKGKEVYVGDILRYFPVSLLLGGGES